MCEADIDSSTPDAADGQGIIECKGRYPNYTCFYGRKKNVQPLLDILPNLWSCSETSGLPLSPNGSEVLADIIFSEEKAKTNKIALGQIVYDESPRSKIRNWNPCTQSERIFTTIPPQTLQVSLGNKS